METKNLIKVIEPIKKEVERIELDIEVEIRNEKDLQNANEKLILVKTIQKQVSEKKSSIIKPLNQALLNVRALFAPIEDRIYTAEKVIKNKIIEYTEKQRKKAEKEKEKLAKKVEKGQIGFDEAVEKLEKVESVQKNIKTDDGVTTVKVVKKVVIENESLLPREYLIPDMVKIRADALAGKEIPGVKVVDEKILAIKIN
jgi:hypothetical protein